MKSQISELLKSKLNPEHLEIIDESYKHQGHAGVDKAEESHFLVIIDRNSVLGNSTLEKHKTINSILDDIIRNKIHALQIKLI
jgi:BolA protein